MLFAVSMYENMLPRKNCKHIFLYFTSFHATCMECIKGSEETIKCQMDRKYRQISNIRHTLLGNKIVDHSDAVGASPVGAAPTTSSFST